jgi:hypothetical protein
VRIELDLSDRLSSLAMEGFDLAIRHTAAPPDTHVAWTLCETRSVLVASRAYLRRRGTPREPQALAGHDCLHYPRAQDTPTWHFEARKPPRSPPARPRRRASRCRCRAAGRQQQRGAARRGLTGLGIALVPDFSAQSALQSGKLVEVLPQWRSVGAFGERLYAIRP